ncbi:MAG TPA: hypothetical protein VLE91_01900 [Candidatus Saccharimonadales bacterium]|nr:hypothetical protein [Candidatus Saccharimonadales bacterium]
MKKLFLKFYLLSTTYYLLSTTSVFASSSDSFTIDNSIFGPAAFGTVGKLATNILTILTSAAGALAVIFIILSGLKFANAGGDEKKMEGARNTITYAIIGVAVTVLAFIILQLVQHFFGSNVTIT